MKPSADIATRVSAVPEIVVHGATGTLVEPGDVEGIAAAVMRLLTDTTIAHTLGEEGERRARTEFSVDRMTERTLSVYDRALSS